MSWLALASCGSGRGAIENPAALQRLAAETLITAIAANPAGLETVCLTFVGEGTDAYTFPELDPTFAPRGPRIRPAAGCGLVDDVLRDVHTGAQALSVDVRPPERVGRSRASVRVVTSNASFDLTAYECTFRRTGGAWASTGCRITAIS